MAGASHKARAVVRRRRPVPARQGASAGAVAARIAPLLRAGGQVQAKLKIGAANDPAEREADIVAARALSATPGAGDHAAPAAPMAATRLQRSAMDQPSLDALDQSPPVPEVAQDVEVSEQENVAIEALDGGELEELEAGTPAEAGAEQEELIRAKSADGAIGPVGGDAPADVAQRIEAPGTGRPLPAATRRDMEARFGTSFADVRLHDTPAARDTAAAIGARAFAHGAAIWMGPGESHDNKALMAHELAHVVQQTGRTSRLMPRGSDTPAPSAAEPKRRVDRSLDDALLSRIEGFAQNLPGYLLLTVLLGKSPITGKEVARTPGKVLGGLLGLVPGGSILVEQLGLAKSMDAAYEWVLGQLSAFGLTWTRIKSVIARAREAFSLRAPIDSLRPVFEPVYASILSFARAVKDKVMEFIVEGALRTAGPFGAKVWGILQKAGDTLLTILANPARFAKNLILAVLRGFGLFLSNILGHLKKGLLGFLFGSLDGLDLELPERLDLKGIFSLVTQILGLTWKRIRKILVKRLGRRGETIVSFLEKSVDVIRLLVREGVMAIWQKVLSLIDNLKSTVIGGLIEFVTVSLAKAAVGWLAGLSNPVGWIVKIVLIIYDFIVLFLERMQQVAELAASIFTSVSEIALGKIDAAAKSVEAAIGRTIPLVLAFLAAIIPVTGIASKIRKIFNRLRKPVERAISKLVRFLVRKAKKLLSKLIGKLNRARKLPGATFGIGKKTHRIFAEKKGRKVEIYVKSEKRTKDEQQDALEAEKTGFQKNLDKEELRDVLAFILAFEKSTDAAGKDAKKVRIDSRKTPQKKAVAELKREIEQAAIDLGKYGVTLGKNPKIDTDDPKVLIRFREDISGFEGQTGLYARLETLKKKTEGGDPEKTAHDRRVLELDHNPNLASLRVVQDWLRQNRATDADDAIHFKKSTMKTLDAEEVGKSSFGNLSLRGVGERGRQFPAMAIYGPVNTSMAKTDAARATEMETLTKSKTLGDIPAIKAKLREQMRDKSDEIETAYTSAPAELGKNISAGNHNIALLADETLKLSETDGALKKDLDGNVAGLFRAKKFAGGENDPDFVQNEGLVGRYSGLSGTKTAAKYLEADHNPTRSDMQTATGWSLRQVMGNDKFKTLLQHEAITELPVADRRLVRKRLKNAMKEPMNPKGFTPNMGGAMVVSARVNQDASMKVPDTAGLTRAKKAARDKFTSEIEYRVAHAAIKNRAPATVARTSMRLGLLDGLRTMIHARQEHTFALYAQKELPQVRAINPGPAQADKAVGLMARIAARVRNSRNAAQLFSIADSYLPR